MTRSVAPNRTIIGFAIILIAALLAIAFAATHSEPEVSHFAPPHAATAAER